MVLQSEKVEIDYSPRQFIKNILVPDTRQVKAHELVNNSPYPSRSPYGVAGFPSTVLHVPQEEIEHFLDTVVSRYIKTIKKEIFDFRSYSNEYIPMSDEEFVELFQNSLYSRFVNFELDEVDEQIFSQYISKDKSYCKVDFAHLDAMESLEKFYYCSTITLFERRENSLVLVAVKINDIIVCPGEIDWEITKLFVLQGAVLSVLICDHPKHHFPMDAINGVTKSILPDGHILKRLLSPHMYMQLPLNFAVLYVNKSVAHNDQNEIYTPFPCSKNGFIESLRASYQGIEGNSSYKSYSYPRGPEAVAFSYGKFLENYWWQIYHFVAQFLQDVEVGDQDISLWAKECAHFIPGFPGEHEIWSADTLIRAVTVYIYTVSVAHSCDHYDYAKHSIQKMPLRIRIAPPSSLRRNIDFSSKTVFTRFDIFRHSMAMKMYFEPTLLVGLMEASYETETYAEKKAVVNFKKSLLESERSFSGKSFIPLREIACSIQY